MKPLVLFAMFTAALALALPARALDCRTVDGDYIHGSDLAAASPAFAGIDPKAEIGYSPLPGIERLFHSSDLLRLAHNYGIAIATAPAAVCFERKETKAQPAASRYEPSPVLVRRGDKVAVRVTARNIVLHFESQAQSSGRRGDTVIVLNPENGARFVARVEDTGKVLVER